MTTSQQASWLLIIVSMIIALLLTLLPLPHWAEWYRPHWVALISLYWVTFAPNRVSIGSVWLLGLLLDIASSTILGEHALALAISCFFAAKWYRQIRMFPLHQQAGVMCLLIWVYLTVIFLIQGIQGYHINYMGYWLSCLTSALIWPLVIMILSYYQRRTQLSS